MTIPTMEALKHLKLPSSITTDIAPLPVILAALLLLIPLIATLSSPNLRNLQSRLLLRLAGRKNKKSYDIVALRVYPIKSCRGLTLPKTTLRLHGVDLDRRWMFVDARTNEFITIRQNSRMTLINTSLSDDGQFLQLSVSGDKTGSMVRIPARPSEAWLSENTTLETVKIWNVVTDGYVYKPEVNVLVSRFLEQEVRLVYKGPTPRLLQGNGNAQNLGRVHSTYFPDQMPVLIASESSISELNRRLTEKGENPITVERFRPNIIVKGNVPWSEDKWKTVRICDAQSGDNSDRSCRKPIDIDIVSRCARCQVPNVEPTTGQKHKSEPWNTLMSYRRVDKGSKYKPCFGMLSAPRSEGEIEVGMKLEVLTETDQHMIIQGGL